MPSMSTHVHMFLWELILKVWENWLWLCRSSDLQLFVFILKQLFVSNPPLSPSLIFSASSLYFTAQTPSLRHTAASVHRLQQKRGVMKTPAVECLLVTVNRQRRQCTYRGRLQPAERCYSLVGGRRGRGAAVCSWRRWEQSLPGYWGRRWTRRSTDGGTWRWTWSMS